MALSEGATQFELQFRPTRLGNWEVPKTSKPRPRPRSGATAFIANDRGHLLDPRLKSSASPWTDFRRISLWNRPSTTGCHNDTGNNIDKAVSVKVETPNCQSERHTTSECDQDEQSKNTVDCKVKMSDKGVQHETTIGQTLVAESHNDHLPKKTSHSCETQGNAIADCEAIAENTSNFLNIENKHTHMTNGKRCSLQPSRAQASELKKLNSSHWPIVNLPDCYEQCQLQQLFVRPVIYRANRHPRPTECTKNTVQLLRPATRHSTPSPLPTNSPIAHQLVRKPTEMDLAIYWNITTDESHPTAKKCNEKRIEMISLKSGALSDSKRSEQITRQANGSAESTDTKSDALEPPVSTHTSSGLDLTHINCSAEEIVHQKDGEKAHSTRTTQSVDSTGETPITALRPTRSDCQNVVYQSEECTNQKHSDKNTHERSSGEQPIDHLTSTSNELDNERSLKQTIERNILSTAEQSKTCVSNQRRSSASSISKVTGKSATNPSCGSGRAKSFGSNSSRVSNLAREHKQIFFDDVDDAVCGKQQVGSGKRAVSANAARLNAGTRSRKGGRNKSSSQDRWRYVTTYSLANSYVIKPRRYRSLQHILYH